MKEKGILAGKRIERTARGEPGEFEALSEDELRKVLRKQHDELNKLDELLKTPTGMAH